MPLILSGDADHAERQEPVVRGDLVGAPAALVAEPPRHVDAEREDRERGHVRVRRGEDTGRDTTVYDVADHDVDLVAHGEDLGPALLTERGELVVDHPGAG